MNYAYLRISKAKQDIKRQRHSLAKFTSERLPGQAVQTIEDTASGKTTWKKRKIGQMINQLKPGDQIIFDDLTRVGRNFYETSAIIAEVLAAGAAVITVDPYHEFKDDVISKVYSFAFSLAADLQREFISKQTKSGLASAKAEGREPGRPTGTTKINDKVSQSIDLIRQYRQKGIPMSNIAKLIGVSRNTLYKNIEKIENQSTDN